MRVLVIIPAYNEESCIGATVREVQKEAPWADIVVINDCSTDGTMKVLEELDVCHLDLPVNLGIGGAVQTGYRYAAVNGYDVAVQLDGDGQHDPKYLKDLVSVIESGEADLVTGSRFIKFEGFQSSGLRRAGIRFLNAVISLVSGVKVTDATSGYRAVSSKLIAVYAEEYPTDYPEPEAIVMAKMNKAGIREIPVAMRDRTSGVSSINPVKSIYYMVKVTIALLLRRLM